MNSSLNFGMEDIDTIKAAAVVSLSEGLPETTYNDEVKIAPPLTIKERVALLNGAFPIDQAVLECMIYVSTC